MRHVLIDCYTDEASGLGVPPFLGVYPRYIYGKLSRPGEEPIYLTIDDVRSIGREMPKKSRKTDIGVLHVTRDASEVKKALETADEIIAIVGVQVPGKYLAARPGTAREAASAISGLKARKILTGPAATSHGSSAQGGSFGSVDSIEGFDEAIPDYVSDYREVANCAVLGAKIVRQIPYEVIAEIETARGCPRKNGCSFCTEPLKHGHEFRKAKDILSEAKALFEEGIDRFRLGKQSDIFFWNEKGLREIMGGIRSLGPVRVLHVDNVDPCSVDEAKVKAVVEYCTPGNVAALGVESFDPIVCESNNLNSDPETVMRAIRIINKYGRGRGDNGMPKFLPGLNLIFGLIGETKNTHDENMRWLRMIMDEGLLVRRINIRQAALYPGTRLHEERMRKRHNKMKKYYWKWRDEIRQKIDLPMLEQAVPKGTVLTDVFMEVRDGNNTFGRQFGTYPLIVGVKSRLELNKPYSVEVTGHMLRSVVGRVVESKKSTASTA